MVLVGEVSGQLSQAGEEDRKCRTETLPQATSVLGNLPIYIDRLTPSNLAYLFKCKVTVGLAFYL